MIRIFTKVVLVVALAMVLVPQAFAQGTQYGTIRGAVALPDGTPAAGVTVTASSPAQPGVRTVFTTGAGEYILRNLLPGAYTLTFELEGLSLHQATATVSLGQTTPVDVTMQPEIVEETIHVIGEQASVLASSEVSTTYTAEQVDQLPLAARTPFRIAELAPGLTTNTPNGGQVTISGAFAYDNIFLIDGVDANDNLFGTTNPVFIEDAIADTQVLTSGISAEYGRFSGGVINVVTKSGGNEFSGSFRVDLTNDDWREKTPVEEENGTELLDEISKVYSATLGGYVLKDRIWFFAAARDEESSNQGTLAVTGIPVVSSVTEERYEMKGTWNIGNRHQVQGQYTDRDVEGVRPSFSFSSTLNTVRGRRDPTWLRVARYNGALTNSLFAELQGSSKHFGFRNSHGNEGVVESSPFFAIRAVLPDGSLIDTRDDWHFHAPYFDGTDPEDRDNEQIYGAGSWFADLSGFGSHDIKVGYEDFTSTRVGGNSQTPTNFVWETPVLADASGTEIVDASGDFIPVFIPGEALLQTWLPTRGATIDIQTRSLFVNDRWRLNDHWSFNVGVRYEQVESDATGGILTVDTSRLVPRFGASYDLRGDGKYRFDATYAQYSGKYSEAQFAENTTVGNPRLLYAVYVGPEGTGFGFAPGFDPDNYLVFFAADPTANVRVADDIQSPVVTEYTLSGGTELARGGYLKAVYTHRDYDDFVEDFLCTAAAGVSCPGPGDTGTTRVFVEGIDVGVFNNEVFDNSDVPSREYEALQLIGRYVLSDRWDVNGHWTYQLTNDGNFEGEGTNTPGVSSLFGDFPGYFIPERHFPTGRLNDFQEHRIRLWSTYNFDLGRAGSLATTLLANYDSGATFSFAGSIPRGFTPQQQAVLAAYDSLPGSDQTIVFGERGAGEFASATYFDLGLLYQLPVLTRWDLDVFVKADVFNVLNEDKAIEWNTSISVNRNGPVDANGFPTTFTRGPAFGEPQDNGDFLPPREYQFGVGIRL